MGCRSARLKTDSRSSVVSYALTEILQMARPIDPEKRPAILMAARAVFLEKGYANTRMSEIASRAGVAVGTLYLYFESKEAIARAMAESFYKRIEESLVPELEPALEARATSPDRFRQLVHHAFVIAVEERDLLLLSPSGFTGYVPQLHQSGVSHTPTHAHSKDARADFLRQMGTALATLMAAGRIRRYEDPVVLAELILALSQPVIRTYLTLGPGDRERYEAIFTDFLESALMQSVALGNYMATPTNLPATAPISAPSKAASHASIAFSR